MDGAARAGIDALLADAVDQGVMPGGVLVAVDRATTVLETAFGRTARVPEPGPPVTLDTIYDVASLTKACVTTTIVMRLVHAGRLALDTPAYAWLPELQPPRDRITIRHLLSHASGLPAWRAFYERILAGDLAGAGTPREAIVRMAATEDLEAGPGARSVYSDLGFILLGALCERAAGERLDVLARKTVFEPMGMTSARFADLTAGQSIAGAAPTEVCPRRGLVRGQVHDDNCHAAGGILGHAGLFGTAGDVSRLAAVLCASLRGDKPAGGFPAELVRTFWSPSGVPGSTWRLGWDGPADKDTSAGDLWPKPGVGHLGFTGCSLWIDPPRSRWVVLLSNRVHPSRDDQRIKELRPRLHDALVRALDQE